MATQKQRGNAFEYACLQAFYERLRSMQDVIIEDTKAVNNAKVCFESINVSLKEKMIRAANSSARVIVRLEPQLLYPNNNIPLYLNIQEDSKGQQGDVRDVLCIRKQNEWEIGLSCKHNHHAVKHSRLSMSIDFGERWFGCPCSSNYFNSISPIFDRLNQLREKKALWMDMPDKEDTVYKPLLDAFVIELNRLSENSEVNIPSKLLTYLIGVNDFYKVISQDKEKATIIEAYNIHGTLNNISGTDKPMLKVPILNLPTRFYNIEYKRNSSNTIILDCDNGWSISMRIHSAKKEVEPSLKFDINLKGVPNSRFSHTEPWD